MSSPLPPVDPSDLASIAAGFALEAPFAQGTPHGNGLINDSFVVECQSTGSPRHYILQRINHHVFQDVPALMENVQRVTDHLSKISSPPNRRPLRLIRTVAGAACHVDEQSCHWRCYEFIEGAVSYDVIPSLSVARSAAFAFGEFQAQLVDLSSPRLNETIPDFHNTRQRFAN
ncbi:mucin desulfatase, partial [Opitutaceae bacterium]|nr:mucin desulfatase [Opitutaceae bacterium]